jgi:2'-5' RNA ligase
MLRPRVNGGGNVVHRIVVQVFCEDELEAKEFAEEIAKALAKRGFSDQAKWFTEHVTMVNCYHVVCDRPDGIHSMYYSQMATAGLTRQ